MIGDSDNSHFIPPAFFLGDSPNQRLLELGTLLFNNTDFKTIERIHNPLLLFFFEEQEIGKYNELDKKDPLKKFKYFKYAGYLFGRSGFKEDSNYIFFDMGQFAPIRSGHNHSNISNIIYCFKGQPILIDSGTYIYNIDLKKRNKFRSSRAHNIVSIDNKSQAKIKSRWRWDDLLHIKHLFFKNGRKFIAKVEHDGYTGFNVSRKILGDYKLNWLKVVDRVQYIMKGERKAKISIFFHFPIECNLETMNNYIVINSFLKLEILLNSSIRIIKSIFPYSNYYGVKNNGHLIEFVKLHDFSNGDFEVEFNLSTVN